MKNLKNTITTVGLMAVLAMGTTMANAGILISDKTEAAQCTVATNSAASTIKGLIVVGISGMLLSDGVVINDSTCLTGILISD